MNAKFDRAMKSQAGVAAAAQLESPKSFGLEASPLQEGEAKERAAGAPVTEEEKKSSTGGRPALN